MFRVDWKKVPRGTTLVEIFLIIVVLIKVALAPLDFASAAIMLPIAAIFIVKFLISDERKKTVKLLDEFSSEIRFFRTRLDIIQESQKEVVKQSEEIKSVISKLNLASAFGGRKRGE